jgi:type II secretory pathway component PulF
MKLDEFSFVNQQLAGMVQAGIPLEGALRRTCETLSGGSLRDELARLEKDLAAGTPLSQALSRRQFPIFYTRMLELGAQANDLPGLLTLLANYYQKLHLTWVRLKGLIFYPALVLLFSFAVSIIIASIFTRFGRDTGQMFGEGAFPGQTPHLMLYVQLGLWLPVVFTGLMAAAFFVGLSVRSWREAISWKVTGFKEARLANVGASLALLLRNGSNLHQAIGLVQQLEAESPAGPELLQWQKRLAEGKSKFQDIAADGKVIPPLFVWLVAASGEDWAEGFQHAANVYHERAARRAEVVLYAVLPVSVLVLGMLIVGQLVPMLKVFSKLVGGLVNADVM